ncbi:MAG: gamma-glutamylcyclotransferase [Pyrinomonadaceae bacterium]|nr:gamma-glutamylcyclotransferase [Pyrinomonadaceae bacterium]MDQ3586706.1 gamma-glutamylcyclotransferase [Acidobacteriota bacterium]
MNKHLVFVYGTLRRGGLRAMPMIFPAATFIDTATVQGRLYDFGTYPGLLLDESNSSVVGEVYEVDDETLNKLDAIEADSHYWRKQVELSVGGRRQIGWVYVYNPQFYSRLILIESGDWIEYAKTKTDWPPDTWPDET